ncbi:hypothetical protein VTN77DRAFT_8363 [Rasamsonia byssochlamydoides]|uniref:uncharacterized protein n=1 Tax=Rasamsonia byssochlamydoides TaxID=89139 RepID=UPI003744209D
MSPQKDDKNLERARRLPGHKWQEQRPRITKLYRTGGKTLSKVREIMKVEHDFCATERQYKRKIKEWHLEKNVRAEEKLNLLAELKVSGTYLHDKHSVYSYNGKQVASHKLIRFEKACRVLQHGDSTFFPPSIPSSSNPAEHCNEAPQLYSPISTDLSLLPPSPTIPPPINFPFNNNFYASQHDIFPTFMTNIPTDPWHTTTSGMEFEFGCTNITFLPPEVTTSSSSLTPLLDDSPAEETAEVPFDDISMDPASVLSLLPDLWNDM